MVQTQSLIPSFETKELHSCDVLAGDTFATLSQEIKAFEKLANPLLCDEKYLPFLAYAFKVDFWSDNLAVNDKRELLNSSLLLHQKKGTLFAIERVFEALGMEARLFEWFEYAGLPYHFKIDVYVSRLEQRVGLKEIDELKGYIDIYKNVRSILDSINIRLPVALGEFYYSAASKMDIELSNKLKFDDVGAGFDYAAQGVVDVNLYNSPSINYEALGDIQTTGGLNVGISLDNSFVFNNDVNFDLNITGGVVWQY